MKKSAGRKQIAKWYTVKSYQAWQEKTEKTEASLCKDKSWFFCIHAIDLCSFSSI